MSRERQLHEAFIELTDTLVDDYDIVDLLHRLAHHCVQLLGVAAAGLVLADSRGGLRVAASSAEQPRLLELFALQTDEGPCADCYRTGAPVTAPDLAAAAGRWPRFGPAAVRQGFRSEHALPMRLRDDTLGSLGLFATTIGPLARHDLRAAQALADAATIGILHERALHRSETLVEQLRATLNGRVVIEQAKGVLAERGRISPDAAFFQLRLHARSHHLTLTEVAQGVIAGTVSSGALLAWPGPPDDAA